MSTSYTKANEAVLATASKTSAKVDLTNVAAPAPTAPGEATPTSRYVTVTGVCGAAGGTFRAKVWVRHNGLVDALVWSVIETLGFDDEAKTHRIYIGAADAVTVSTDAYTTGATALNSLVAVGIELPQ